MVYAGPGGATSKIGYFFRPRILQQKVVLIGARVCCGIGGSGDFEYFWAGGTCKEWELDRCACSNILVCIVRRDLRNKLFLVASLRVFLVGGSKVGEDVRPSPSISLATRFAETERVTGHRCGRLKTSTSDGSSSELLKVSFTMDLLSTRGSL